MNCESATGIPTQEAHPMRRLWVFLSGLWAMVALPQGEWVASGSGETRTQTIAVLDERAKPVTHTALVVVGAGEPSTYWRNTQWELQPNRTYASGRPSAMCSARRATRARRLFASGTGSGAAR